MKASEFSTVYTKQQRIAQLAKQSPEMAFTSLAYHMDVEWLEEAYRQTRKTGTAGIDGMTAKEYEDNLQKNLKDLLERAKSGRYKAPAVKRAYIPKGQGGELRPIGIPTLEDKVLQRAVCMLLEPIYEQDFMESSFGFRPGRSQHQALEVIWRETMDIKGGWILDVDIRKYFDTIDHAQIREMLRQRVNDGVITRLIGKWLNAGVQEQGQVSYPESGSPQGGVISPLLSNIYLHYVMDVWFETTVKPRMKAKTFMVRFADDLIVGFKDEEDARRVLEVLPKRYAKFGLTVHPEKTRLVAFKRPRKEDLKPSEKTGTFDFLGFTHYWGRNKKGNWVVKRKTASKRLSGKIQAITKWCKDNRHLPIRDQHEILCVKLRGHYQYYGISGNYRSINAFRHAVLKIWRKSLNRRSQKGKRTWNAFKDLLHHHLPLPEPKIMHSYI
ncbi:group II intron reverse transcriptase/maturase [Desulfitobacterium sp. Sab5]|uniref:group II intron reverse transcriptase/maturase n=1 Tax=Desulfitobacterium nosdiversum TaxID=3375356 RepID=UPI003CF4D383